MSYLFITNLLQREKFVLFTFIKNLNKTQQNAFLVGFLGGFFIGNPAWSRAARLYSGLVCAVVFFQLTVQLS
jgi:hypothetical protein